MKKIIWCLTGLFVFVAGIHSAFAQDAAALQGAFIDVAKKVGPAVVSISTVHTERIGVRRYRFGASPFNDELFDRFFRDFFEGIPKQKEFQQRGLGSGVIISQDGLILTNEHVIKGADEITVTLPDGRKFKGQIKGADPRSDLAVIKIEAQGLPFAQLGDSDEVKIGQWSIAIGNPFGYMVGSSEPTMTVGIVSALGRSIRTQPELDKDYAGLIQTDAAINPGNSGGPLVDINGKVIGINVAIFSTSGGYQGIGFAIPVNRAKENIPDLAQGKKIQYGWIGVRIQDLDEQLSKFFKLPDTNGVLVIEVVKDTPASAAGLKERDVITGFNAIKINNVQQLVENISHSKIGSAAKLSVTRDGKPLTLTINIAARSEETAKQIQKAQPKTQEGLTRQWRGIEVSEDEGRPGVVVSKLDPNSPAYNAGLRIGDVIEEMNRIQINSLTDFSDVVGSLKGDALVRTARGYTIVKEENIAP